MDKKEYLSQVFNLDRKIYLMKLEAEEYRRLSMSIPGGDFTQPRIDKSPTSSQAPFVQWIHKALDKEKEIEEFLKKISVIKADIMNSINELQNEDYKMVLLLRYIQSLKFPEIASKMYAAESTIKRWHREAIGLIVVPEKYKNL